MEAIIKGPSTPYAMLAAVIVGIWLFGGIVGAVYFASPRRQDGYDRQHAIFTYVQGIIFGLIPALGGAWGWSIFTVPIGVFIATKIIDRRQEANWERERASRHHDATPGR
jgi:hypothetical protein